MRQVFTAGLLEDKFAMCLMLPFYGIAQCKRETRAFARTKKMENKVGNLQLTQIHKLSINTQQKKSNMVKIYTKTGDRGMSGIGADGRTRRRKDAPVFAVLGGLQELSSRMGIPAVHVRMSDGDKSVALWIAAV